MLNVSPAAVSCSGIVCSSLKYCETFGPRRLLKDAILCRVSSCTTRVMLAVSIEMFPDVLGNCLALPSSISSSMWRQEAEWECVVSDWQCLFLKSTFSKVRLGVARIKSLELLWTDDEEGDREIWRYPQYGDAPA